MKKYDSATMTMIARHHQQGNAKSRDLSRGLSFRGERKTGESQLCVNGHAFIATGGVTSGAAHPSRAEVGAERSFRRRVLTSSRGAR